MNRKSIANLLIERTLRYVIKKPNASMTKPLIAWLEAKTILQKFTSTKSLLSFQTPPLASKRRLLSKPSHPFPANRRDISSGLQPSSPRAVGRDLYWKRKAT